MERTGLGGYLIPGISSALLAVAILLGSLYISLGILAGLVLTLFAYSEWASRSGEILGDERTIRIDEAASRRTLQVLIVVMSVSVVVLSILSGDGQFWRGAYLTSSVFLALAAALKIALKHHYARVM